ncbi:unnamed protein product [Haemonchus placei]|uniref:SH3 domain-containing protein n=1 Tax=Haemonchus placei TaxID=6290 RepID=A0A158QJW0_HAEPC|nr:unnamed protein product [Haemonchus placei]
MTTIEFDKLCDEMQSNPNWEAAGWVCPSDWPQSPGATVGGSPEVCDCSAGKRKTKNICCTFGMHAIARENLQHFLYSYKESPKEQGLRLIHDAKKSQALRREREHQRALQNLRAAVVNHINHRFRAVFNDWAATFERDLNPWVLIGTICTVLYYENLKVAFAVRANSAYDGALEDESPIQKKTISFKKGDFIHIYKRYTHDWWIGRVVAAESTIGFVPTARRLARLTEEQVDEREKSTDKNTIVAREAEIWEYPNPYTVVPSTRPIILLGPCYQSSRLTQLMHAAVRSAIVKKFGSRVRRLTTDIGEKDINERELRLITAMTEDLHLILLECPNISTPGDVAHLNMAPILLLFRISNRKILLKLLKKTGIKGHSAIAGADFLNQLAPDQVDVIIEDNGLHEATNKIFKFLEAYWLALHPTTPILEEEYSEKPPESSGTSDKTDNR